MFELDELVSENRFTIAVIFPLIGAITFIASAEGLLPESLSFNPFFILFGTLVMRLPLIAGMKPLMSRKAWSGLVILTSYAYIIEYIGLETGLPYGEFEYLVALGPMFSGVPIGLPVFFIPLVVNAFLLAVLYDIRKWKLVPAVIAATLLIDMVLDPAAVSLGIWSYVSGIYYGVPLSNYLGWILSASIASIIIYVSVDMDQLGERLEKTEFMMDDMVSFVLLWGFINLYYMNLIPVIIAAGFAVALRKTERFDMAF